MGADNVLGQDIWHNKYQSENETFKDWLARVSGGNEEVKTLIWEKKFLFGGRILANRGLQKAGKKITYSNCYVTAPPEDNIESIFETAAKLARTYSYGGGCGMDLSRLAPKGAKVNNAAKETSGAVSFMDLFSTTTGLIGQNGRRGALMLSLDCHHPDLLDFIHAKSDLNKVTKANISVRITDDFMRAVEADADFELSFTRAETGETIARTIKAREVFYELAKMNWDYAEPGVLFWDRIKDWNLLSTNDEFEYAGTNPCAEEPLPAGGSCLLGSINLSEFVNYPFTKKAHFDLDGFQHAVRIGVRALNDVLDEGMDLHPLPEQRESVRSWRQIGLGVMGIADMLIKLGLRYGSQRAVTLCSTIGSLMAETAIECSCDLAQQNGQYPKCNSAGVMLSSFFQVNLGYAEDIANRVLIHGLRNSQLLTIAPTGTLSTMLGVSGGIEPIFAKSYTRKTESLHKGGEVSYVIYTPVIAQLMAAKGITSEADLPDYVVTAQELDYKERIDMQAAWQKHIDASISSTVNVPHSFTPEQTFDLYMTAWKKGLKGITIYREGCKRSGILTTDQSEHQEEAGELPRGYIEDVPDCLEYKKFKLETGCGRLYLFVGYDESDGKIYDVFTNTDGTGGCSINTQANSRLISACIRGGVPVEYIVEQLNKAGTCPSFQYKRGRGESLCEGKSCASAIGNVLRTVLRGARPEELEQKEAMNQSRCPSCGEPLIYEGGCNVCRSCGWSKCD